MNVGISMFTNVFKKKRERKKEATSIRVTLHSISVGIELHLCNNIHVKHRTEIYPGGE